MKPAAFQYVRATSIAHALDALAQAQGNGKIIAGGQSLVPMMNFRLVKPAVLVDINHIPGLDRIERQDGRMVIGALTRHHMTASSPLIAQDIPLLHEVMKNVAHLTVRNRGTFCGSVSHNDPAAEMPMICLLLNGLVHMASPRGERVLAARDFLTGSLSTALEPDEMVTRISLECLPADTGWGFQEFARRQGDYALAAVAVTVRCVENVAREARVAVMGVGETALRLPEVETALNGAALDPDRIAAAAALVPALIHPNSDLNASAEYRRHTAAALARRVIADAWRRARPDIRRHAAPDITAQGAPS